MKKVYSLVFLALVSMLNTAKAKSDSKFINEIQASLDGEILVSLDNALKNQRVFAQVDPDQFSDIDQMIQDDSLKAELEIDTDY